MAVFNKKTVRDVDVKGKRVMVRVDYNVPLTPEGKIADDSRIMESVPTLRYLRSRGAMLIIVSHLGRPEGKVNPKYSMRVVSERLGQLLDTHADFCPECIGELPKAKIARMKPGDVVVLENVRFYPGEEANDPAFVAELASLADIYVNDAFGTVHRSHASTVGVAKKLPSFAGLLMEREVVVMGRALSDADRPFLGIMGGAKVKDKLGVVENLLPRVDYLLMGGGIAHTFLAAKGYNMYRSIMSAEHLEWATNLLHTEAASKIILPDDLVVAAEFNAAAESKVVPASAIPDGWLSVDIGPQTIANFTSYIAKAKTIVWNGPMGAFEMPPFDKGTKSLAMAVGDSYAVSIVGGGDTAAAVERLGISFKINHVSTGGGSTLKFLAGKELPAIEALDDLT